MKKLSLSLLLIQTLIAVPAFGDSRVGPMSSDEFKPGSVVCPYIATNEGKNVRTQSQTATKSLGTVSKEAR